MSSSHKFYEVFVILMIHKGSHIFKVCKVVTKINANLKLQVMEMLIILATDHPNNSLQPRFYKDNFIIYIYVIKSDHQLMQKLM